MGRRFDLKVIDEVTGQVKFGMFQFSGLVISLSKITMVQTKPMNRHGYCIGQIYQYHFLCFVIIIQVKVIAGHQVITVKPKHSRVYLDLEQWVV